jgi:hypothetical protein
LEWLEKCKKETADYPLLRESIRQYITLVRSLTGQGRNKQVSDEILASITKDDESFAAYLSITAVAKEAVFRYMLNNKIFPDLRTIAEKHDLEFEEPSDGGLLQEDYGFKFFDGDEASEHICIFFAFGENLSDLRVGIYNDSGGGWLSGPDFNLGAMDKYKNWHWNNTDVFKKLCLPNNDVIREIEDKIVELLPLLNAEIKKRKENQVF